MVGDGGCQGGQGTGSQWLFESLFKEGYVVDDIGQKWIPVMDWQFRVKDG